MSDQRVTCPECKHEFELGKAWTDKVSRELRAEIEVEARRRIKEELAVDLQAAKDELKEKDEKLASARKAELELRKQQRALQDRQEALELEVAKKLDAERVKLIEEAKTKADEQQQLKLREKENHIKSLNDQIAELKRRAEVGSQEGQGEALEGELIDVLRRQFPLDECEEIKKGQRGADILQRVRSQSGTECGTILWESKNAKSFANDWVGKLKRDQQEVSASLAVLMTMVTPAEVDGFDQYNGVWVTDFGSALSLCGVLRQMLIAVDRERLVSAHKEGMKDVIYTYITGNDFGQRVKMIASAYQQMHADLQSEKNSMNRIWKKREKQITSVLDNVSGMLGEIEGLTTGGGASLPKIESLTLEAIAEDEDE
jgi:hypothetical protein